MEPPKGRTHTVTKVDSGPAVTRSSWEGGDRLHRVVIMLCVGSVFTRVRFWEAGHNVGTGLAGPFIVAQHGPLCVGPHAPKVTVTPLSKSCARLLPTTLGGL